MNLEFEYQGTLIKNPNLDESGRFEVNPIEYYGQAYLDALFVRSRKNTK